MPGLKSILGEVAEHSIRPVLSRLTRPRTPLVSAHLDSASIDHARVMHHLSTRLSQLLDVIPPYSKVVYLDYPVHHNIGDLLLCLGTEAFFRRAQYQVVCRLSLDDLCEWRSLSQARLRGSALATLDRIPPDVPLVFHGGGNLGDLYPHHQTARRLIAARYRARTILVLPQSIHFDNADTEQFELNTLRQHPRLHLCVRDEESRRTALRHDVERVHLLPDMAHALWLDDDWRARTAVRMTPRDVLYLLRRDKESALQQPATARDWEDLISPVESRFGEIMNAAMCRGLDPNYHALQRLWYLHRDRLIARAVKLLSAHERVYTDRLHAALLAALLGRPSVLANNRNGKVLKYAACWLTQTPLVQS